MSVVSLTSSRTSFGAADKTASVVRTDENLVKHSAKNSSNIESCCTPETDDRLEP